jgi:uncharacterized membrane protein YhaH (DUF805 family)
MNNIDFNKLWQNFLNTVQNHYADFNGRVGRPQFWYFVLVEFVIFLALAIIQSILWTNLLTALAGLALLLPNAGMATRRIQDTGRNGTIVWAWIIPAAIMQVLAVLAALGSVVGGLLFLAFFLTFGWILGLIALIAGIAVIYFCAQPGQLESNQYGPPPPVWTPGGPVTTTPL